MEPEQTLSQAAATQPQTVEDAASQLEQIQVLAPGSGESTGVAGTSSTHPLNAAFEAHLTRSRFHENPYADFERVPVAPTSRSRDGHVRVSSRLQTLPSNGGLPIPPQNTSGIDWIVPTDEKGGARRTVGERLQPTVDNAIIERDKYAKKALWTGYALNIAIGLQVLLGALTTAGKQAQVSTAILGGLATLVASYMARARGSGEPELSITRVKDLEQFLRDCRAFQMDHAHEYSTPENGLNNRLEDLRRKFEELLGNANGYASG